MIEPIEIEVGELLPAKQGVGGELFPAKFPVRMRLAQGDAWLAVEMNRTVAESLFRQLAEQFDRLGESAPREAHSHAVG